jgi:hypothetical protein
LGLYPSISTKLCISLLIVKPGSARNSVASTRTSTHFHPYNRKTFIYIRNVPLENPTFSALRKGLICAVTSVAMPVEDILCGVEKAICALPEDTAEEVW